MSACGAPMSGAMARRSSPRPFFCVQINVLTTIVSSGAYAVTVLSSFKPDFAPTAQTAIALLADRHYLSTTMNEASSNRSNRRWAFLKPLRHQAVLGFRQGQVLGRGHASRLRRHETRTRQGRTVLNAVLTLPSRTATLLQQLRSSRSLSTHATVARGQ